MELIKTATYDSLTAAVIIGTQIPKAMQVVNRHFFDKFSRFGTIPAFVKTGFGQISPVDPYGYRNGGEGRAILLEAISE